MTEVIMPKMGDGMEEGTLVEWLKKEGDEVKSGEVIGTIQTDKATLELEAPGKGVLAGFLIQPGQTVPVGVPIAAILKKDESLPAGWGGAAGAQAAAAATVENAPVVAESAPVAVEAGPASRAKASPLAKKVAAEAGLDLGSVTGTGPNGRITVADVEAAIATTGTKIPATLGAPALPSGTPAEVVTNHPVPVASNGYTPPPVATTAEDKKIPLNRLRGIIAQRTQHSKQNVPHFYVTVEVDLERINVLREAFKTEGGGKISVNDFVVRATTLALLEMPIVNSTFMGDHILQFGAVNIGIAAAVDDGLLVPVIHNAHTMTLRQLSDEAKRLVAKAREGKLTPNEMQGSTFSLSNMGMLDVDNFSAIINEPNAGIIAISSARKKVVVTDQDELEVRWRMNITGSFDHRVVDGALGAEFVNRVRAYLENPTRLLS